MCSRTLSGSLVQLTGDFVTLAYNFTLAHNGKQNSVMKGLLVFSSITMLSYITEVVLLIYCYSSFECKFTKIIIVTIYNLFISLTVSLHTMDNMYLNCVSLFVLGYYCMYQRQQNTLYPKGDRSCKNNFLKLLIGSQPIIDIRVLI